MKTEMKVRPQVLERNLRLANKLAKANGGFLPNPNRLIGMGYGGLYRYIHRHPILFEHLEYQDAVGEENETTFNIGIREKHLKTAERLFHQHGKLPSPRWLDDNEYTKLASYLRTYPKVFSKLTRKRTGMTHATTSSKSLSRGRKRKKSSNPDS